MIYQKITDNFYRLENVLSDELQIEILEQFNDTSSWDSLPDANNINRLELHLHTNSMIAEKIFKTLKHITTIAEEVVGKLYPNSPQLWLDHAGYMSRMHKDFSPNIKVNIQVYLDNGAENMGTACFDTQWLRVPYKKNTGYMLICPTEITHGMYMPVIDKRLSLYQSYRSTINALDLW